MRHKERRRRSKLKLRPYGVITIQDGEPGKDHSAQTTVSRPKTSRASRRATTKNKTKFFLALLKGLTVLLLLAIAIGWANSNSFSTLFQANTNLLENTTLQDNKTIQDNKTLASSARTTDSVDADQLGTTTTENEANSSQSKPTETPVTSENSSATDEKSGNVAAQNSTSEALVANTLTNQENPAPVDPEKQAIQDTTSATIDNPPEALQPENLQPDTTQPETTDNNVNGNFIKAYKASVFSSLAADATETPVQHGAAVIVLERTGDWVKIEIPDSGIAGFIHVTHLSISE